MAGQAFLRGSAYPLGLNGEFLSLLHFSFLFFSLSMVTLFQRLSNSASLDGASLF
jgi:hypothetical protein